MGEEWQNRSGRMKLADFITRKTFREIGRAELSGKSGDAPAFRAWMADFCALLQPGDVLYHYDSDPEDWAAGFGSEGYAIVRDGELLDTLVIRMN